MENSLEGIKEVMVTNVEMTFLKVEKLMQSYQDKCNQLLDEVTVLRSRHTDDVAAMNTVLEENTRLKSTVLNHEKDAKSLKQMVALLEEENHGFKKVSQIIHYEKENSKLRQQVASLEERLMKKTDVAVAPTASASVSEDLANTDIEVYEKKINKIVYFVSNDESRRIFQKTEEGDVGLELGHLEEVNGKLKPVWLADA